MKCESQILELKVEEKDTRKDLYDSLSSFFDQNDIREVPRATLVSLNQEILLHYIELLK